MKRTRRAPAAIAAIAVIAVIAIAGLALGLSLSVPAGAATSRTASAARTDPAAGTAARTRIVALDCLGMPVVRPGSYVFACADANDYLTKMTWTSWTPSLASGYGVEMINDCVPDCVAGHFHGYPVLVVFWGHATVPGHSGELRYTETTLIYPGVRPPGYKNGKEVPGSVTRTFLLPG